MCTGGCNDDPTIVVTQGAKGDTGFNGWTPLLAVVNDSARRVLQITGWTGGTGTTPSYTNQYIGPLGIVEDIANAVDIRGATGTGATGADGTNGWSPVFAVITDSARRVLKIVDWTGGTGTKPSTTNQYIGAAGIVNSAAAAVDIRGAAGANGSDAVIASQTGNSGKFLTTNGTITSWAVLPSQFPSILSNTQRVLREKSDGTGVEFYSSLATYINIPMQENGIFSTTTSWVTLRNSGSTVFLKTTLPSDGETRRLLISASIVLRNNSGDGSNAFTRTGIRNITADTSLTDENIYTYFRPVICLQYAGTFICSGQDIGVQFKYIAGQNTATFFGGHISFIEIL